MNRSFEKAHQTAITIKILLRRLGDPSRMASLLAAESELYGAEGKQAEQALALADALDVATHGSAYDLIPKFNELSTAFLKTVEAEAMAGRESPAGLKKAIATLESKLEAARSVYNLSLGRRQKLDDAINDLQASRIASALKTVDPMLKQLEGTEDYGGIAMVKGIKAQLTTASGNIDEVISLYLEAVRDATKSGNAELVWPIADNLILIVQRLEGLSPGSREERVLENAKSSLSRELKGFVDMLLGQEVKK